MRLGNNKTNKGKQTEAHSETAAEKKKKERDLQRRVVEPPKKGGKRAGTPKEVRLNMDRTGGKSARKAVKSRGRRSPK